MVELCLSVNSLNDPSLSLSGAWQVMHSTSSSLRDSEQACRHSLADRHTLNLWRRRDGLGIPVELISGILASTLIINAHAPLQETALLDGTARQAHLVRLGGLQVQAVVGAVWAAVGGAGAEVWDCVWGGVLDANVGHACIRGLACFAHGVVTAVEVLALLTLGCYVSIGMS